MSALSRNTQRYLDHFYEARIHAPRSQAWERETNNAHYYWRQMSEHERQTAIRHMRGQIDERGGDLRPRRDIARTQGRMRRRA